MKYWVQFPVAYHRPWHLPVSFIGVHACESQAPDLPPSPRLGNRTFVFCVYGLFLFFLIKKSLRSVIETCSDQMTLTCTLHLHFLSSVPFPKGELSFTQVEGLSQTHKAEEAWLDLVPRFGWSQSSYFSCHSLFHSLVECVGLFLFDYKFVCSL